MYSGILKKAESVFSTFTSIFTAEIKVTSILESSIMKIPALAVLLFIATLRLFSQVGGNQLYDQEVERSASNIQYSNQTPPKRNPAASVEVHSNSEIVVRVTGLMNVVADKYVAVFNVIQVAETAAQTDALMNERLAALRSELRKVGYDSSAVFVDFVSFLPRYDYQAESKLFSKTYNEVPAGFELQKNIMVHFTKSSQLDDIVTAAAQSEIYDLIKVDYFLKDQTPFRDSLRTRCQREFRTKTKAYENLGIRTDSLKRVANENFVVTYPPVRYFPYQAFSRPSLNAARKKNTVAPKEVHKVVSRYYGQVEPDGYDIVINPVITEPVVQITYAMIVKFFLPETPQKSNYYLVTPAGDIKQFFPK